MYERRPQFLFKQKTTNSVPLKNKTIKNNLKQKLLNGCGTTPGNLVLIVYYSYFRFYSDLGQRQTDKILLKGPIQRRVALENLVRAEMTNLDLF